MELFIQLLKLYGAGLLGYGFIFFVILRLYNSKNYLRMALASLITGLSLIILTILGIMFDSFREGALFVAYSFIQPYYVFFNVAILLTFALSLTFFIMGKKRRQSFRSFPYKVKKTTKPIPTIVDEHEFVYVVFKRNDNYLLKKIKVSGEDYYTTLIEKLNNKIFFHDEMIKHIIGQFGLREESHNHDVNYKLVGEVTKHEKIDNHYYCYVVNVEEINDKLRDYVEINPYDLINYQMNDFDKQILYHIILKDYFKIEL